MTLRNRLATMVAVMVIVAGSSCQTVPQDAQSHVANAHSAYNALVAAYLKLDDADLVPPDVQTAFEEAEQYAYGVLQAADAAVATGKDFDLTRLDDAIEALQNTVDAITEVALGSG